MDLPDWITGCLDRWTPGAYPFRGTEEFPDILEGDLVLVGAMEGTTPAHRMVVALEVDEERRLFLGAPVTTDLWLATADSVILTPDHTGLPYQIAVLSGLAVHLWFVQADERLGALTEEALEAVSAGRYGAEDRFQISCRGVPLQRPTMDLRWPELKAESHHMRELARDCMDKLWDDTLDLPYVDPRLLSMSGDSSNEFYSGALSILEEETREGRTRGFSPSCVEQMARTLDCRILRAYPNMLRPRGWIATSPPVCGDPDDPSEWLFELTVVDALAGAGFVKMIGIGEPSGPSRFERNGQRYEFLYETVEGTSE